MCCKLYKVYIFYLSIVSFLLATDEYTPSLFFRLFFLLVFLPFFFSCFLPPPPACFLIHRLPSSPTLTFTHYISLVLTYSRVYTTPLPLPLFICQSLFLPSTRCICYLYFGSVKSAGFFILSILLYFTYLIYPLRC